MGLLCLLLPESGSLLLADNSYLLSATQKLIILI